MDISALYPDQVAPKAIAEACEGLPISAADVWYALDEDLAALDAGKISGDALRAFVVALAMSRTRQQGDRPKHYDQAVVCARCGPIWLWRGAPANVESCPWCVLNGVDKDSERPEEVDRNE